MKLDLNGKVVIVTGGASNIGRAIALGFAKEGCNVINAEIDEDQGHKVVDQANMLKGGGKMIVIRTDVTDWTSVQAMVRETLDEFGRIDVLVNNVGWNQECLFIEKTREIWEKEIALNFGGFINCTRAVLDQMIAQQSGSIVSISSDAGRMGEYKNVVYSGCKGGIISSSKSLARELGRYGIRVNVVCPGMTPPASIDDTSERSTWRTDSSARFLDPEMQAKALKLYPLRKFGRPEDIANAVIFLASAAAGHVTGQTLSVSGGYTMM